MSASRFRDRFVVPDGAVYLDNNSLGLMSVDARDAVLGALDQWGELAIGGWTDTGALWLTLAERVGAKVAQLVGADPKDVVAAGSTTSNLHQLLATLWNGRGAVMMDRSAFPSDRYAVESHMRLRGRDPEMSLVFAEVGRDGLLCEKAIADSFSRVAVAVLPSVVYTSGQLLDMEYLTRAARGAGTLLIWDCAHSVGIVPHRFAEWGVDAAFWCHYKWCNGGPGAVGGLYLHPRFGSCAPGLAGWFGGSKDSLFSPDSGFVPAEGAARLQMGTTTLLSLASVDGALGPLLGMGIDGMRGESLALTGALLTGLDEICRDSGAVVATPPEDARRGGHVAVRVGDAGAKCLELRRRGFVVDHRRPDWIRIAPSPFVNTPADIELTLDAVRDVFGSDDMVSNVESGWVP
jgi:kynureninase